MEAHHLFLQPQDTHLTEDEKANPVQVLRQFFEDYKLSELLYCMGEMVEVCLTTDNTQYSQPEERGDLLTRSRDIIKALETVFLLVQNKEVRK